MLNAKGFPFILVPPWFFYTSRNPKHLGGSAERADRRGGAFGADRGDVEVLNTPRDFGGR